MRARPVTSIVAAWLIAMAPVHALAQTEADPVGVRDRPRPEYDAQGRNLGGFDLHASLGLGVTSNSNVFAEETGEDDDIIFNVTPEASLTSHWSRHALQVAGGADLTSHQDFDTEDAETYYLSGHGRLDIGRDTQLSGDVRWANEVEPRTSPDALLVGEPVEYDQSEASAWLQHTFNRVRVGVGMASSEYDFDDAGAIDQDFRDYTQDSITGRVEVALTPRVAIVGQATSDERDYDNAPLLSSEGKTYLAGIRLNLTNLMSGELTAGAFERDYDFGGSVDGTAIAANLEWYITQLTTLSFEASRAGQESGATVASPYVEEEYGVRVDHELRRNVILSAGLRSGKRDYETIDREDETFYGDVEAIYMLNPRVVLSGRYRHEENESTGLNRYRDYDVDRFTIGASLRL